MAKGKFEIAKSASRSDPYAVMDKPAAIKPPLSASKIWPILAAVAGVAVLVVGILLLTKNGNTLPGESTTVGSDRMAASTTTAPVISTVELKGMPRAELEQRFNELDSLLRRDLTLTLNPQTIEGEPTEDPIVLTLTQADSGAGLDLTRLTADLNADVGKESGDSYLLDPRDYLVIDEDGLRAFAENAAEEYGTEYAPPTAEVEGEANDSTAAKTLVVRTGVTGRSIEAETLYQTLKDAYETVLIAEDPDLALQPVLGYELQLPELVDVNALFERYCKAAREPQLNAKTGEISEGKNGYGFDIEELTAALAQAAPGEEVRVRMEVIKPEMDAETLRAHLFQDVLAEAHTTHTRIADRTNNLKLACAEIDGTILLPGDVFSFNQVVGERTEEKGYKEAIAYVHGGESEPTVGGGICQVASSIYYAVLQADLKTIEREPHMYLVDYVPSGMDTTIYWGYIDYKFENNSPYPLKIEASVSGGKVHIVLLGTEWKDYTVELSYEVLDTEPWKEVEREVPNDGTYKDGEVITTPYTGYKIATYKTTRSKETGKKIETTQIAISRYSKRDKVIARPTGDPVPPPTDPTQPSSSSQRPSSQPTQPSNRPTQPSSQPTQPPTQPSSQPTQPPTQPTQPTQPPTQPTQPTQPTAPPTQPTQPSTEPTTEPTEPSSEPTDPPTEPPTQPTDPPTEPPTQPSESEGG